MKHKIHIAASIDSIDYAKLVSRLQEDGDKTSKPKPVLAYIAKIAPFAPMPVLCKQIKKYIQGQADSCGITLGTLEIADSPTSLEGLGKNSAYKIVALLEVNFNKLAKTVGKSLKKPHEKAERIRKEVVAIVEPFISATMATIPPSAIAKLLKLLVREKRAELAEIGVTFLSFDLGSVRK